MRWIVEVSELVVSKWIEFIHSFSSVRVHGVSWKSMNRCLSQSHLAASSHAFVIWNHRGNGVRHCKQCVRVRLECVSVAVAGLFFIGHAALFTQAVQVVRTNHRQLTAQPTCQPPKKLWPILTSGGPLHELRRFCRCMRAGFSFFLSPTTPQISCRVVSVASESSPLAHPQHYWAGLCRPIECEG